MKKHLRRYLCFLLVMLLSGAAFTAVYFGTGKQYQTDGPTGATDVFAADNGWEMSQRFAAQDNLCGISLSLTPPDGTGRLTVSLLAPDGRELCARTFDAGDTYGGASTVAFANFRGGAAGTYTVRLVSEGYGTPGIGFCIGGAETALLDGAATDYSLAVAPVYSNRVATTMFFTLLIGVMLLIAAVYLLINTLGLVRETAFLVCMLAFLLIGLLIVPLGAGVSETADLPAVYLVSSGQFAPAKTGEGSGVLLPEGLAALGEGAPGYDATLAALEEESGTGVYTPVTGMNTSFPLVYAPAALGMGVARLFTQNAGVLFYAARFSSLLTVLLLLYLTMKLLPYGRRVFFVVCLNPAVLTLFCTVSSASLPILLAFLLFALVLHLREGKQPIGAGQTVVLSLVSLLVGLSSVAFLPLCLLPLLLGRDRFTSRIRARLSFLTTCLLPAAAGLTRAVLAGLSDGSSARTIALIFSSPFRAAGELLVAVKAQLTPLVLSLFGEQIGAGGAVVCGGLASLCIFLLTLFCAMLDRNLKDKFARREKLLLVLLSLSAILLVFAGVYVRAGELSAAAGLCGTAFLPVLLPVLFLLGDNRIKYENDENSQSLRASVFFFGLFPFAFSMLATLICYL